MTAAAVLTRQARADPEDAVRWIAADSLDAAHGLNDAVELAARRLGAHPSIGVRRPALAGERYRFWSIPRYSYVLVYTDQTTPPRIVRIVHTSRDLAPLLAGLPEGADLPE